MEVWVSNNRLTTPLFIEESVPSQERERSCIYSRYRFCLFPRFFFVHILFHISTVLCNFADSVVFLGFQFIKQAMELLVFVFF
jgi:hypothetical protein